MTSAHGDTASEASERLQRRLKSFLGDGTGHVRNFANMEEGHAGLTFGFDLVQADGEVESFVLKVAPAGVPWSGSTDIFRQDRLLRSLRKQGLPVPDVRWSSRDGSALGAPFIVMERLPGRSFFPWAPSGAWKGNGASIRNAWHQMAKAMAMLHRLGLPEDLADWETPATLDGELHRWEKLLRHMARDDWREAAGQLVRRLRQTIPENTLTGLVHGDLHPGNALFEGGDLRGLIDWDLAAIAPVGLDTGWLLMMADPTGWDESWYPVNTPSRTDLLETYWRAGGPVRNDLPWFQAFAHLKLVSITGHNLKLHRDGRREDETWEKFATAVPHLLSRGHDLLDQCQTRPHIDD